MKRLLYSLVTIIAVAFVFSLSNCNNGPPKKPITEDSANNNSKKRNQEIKDIPFVPDTTKQEYPRKVIFVNKKSKDFTKEDSLKYIELGYEIYDKKDFDKYYKYFQEIFDINGQNPTLKNYQTFPYSIYEMYNSKLQFDLKLQAETTTIGLKEFGNFIRIYPAIDTKTSELYLVFLGEHKQPGYLSNTLPDTYFTIKQNNFDKTSDENKKIEIENDIKNFQAIWSKIKDPNNPNYKFIPCESFAYSISSYNQLLSQAPPFMNLQDCKTDINKTNMTIMLVPIIDASDTNFVHLRLVAIAHEKVGQTYIMRWDKEFFDNMFPCPSICPSNRIK